jgi:hypothetical protein
MRKKDGQPLELRVYASTVVPASFVSCLEDQLARELVPLFRGTPFVLQGHLMIAIPTAKPGDDARWSGRRPADVAEVVSSERRATRARVCQEQR